MNKVSQAHKKETEEIVARADLSLVGFWEPPRHKRWEIGCECREP